MAIKERLLSKLKKVDESIEIILQENYRDVYVLLQGVKEAQKICQNGMLRDAYKKYGEIYDGLIMAFKQILLGESGTDTQEILSLCNDLLQHLMVQITKETQFKKEIFFLPYKASMWDSLESVWQAATEDEENCLAYVMPIPYCDRNPDGTAGEWHCERGLFPDYVPTIDWQSVDLKIWHPDVIVFHYPYDNLNYVTSVDSRYYSANLKKCANKLVYIPYFVLEDVIPGNAADEERVLHFVMTSGVLNADQVVVQSETMREVYINILIKYTVVCEREYWEKHILGIGSPKIDKVLGSKREDFDMPEKWLKLIKGKKVILYNTSLTAMMNNTENTCKKISYVFNIFKKRDDVVLWWRPHPLMKATFHSIRPRFEEDYLRLERQYIEEGWGIYDDSPDLHRAIAWSDAYYGDRSSVVSLYRKTNKPILLQFGVPIPLENRCGPISMDIQGNMIWYVTVGLHELCSINILTGQCYSYGNCYEPVIPINLVDSKIRMCYVKALKDKIIIIPWQTSEIVKFDLNTMEFTHISINDGEKCVSILGCVEYNGSIFCYGWDPFIYEYKLGEDEGILHSIAIKESKKNNKTLSNTACIFNHKLWYAYNGGIMSFDLLSYNSIMYDLSDSYGGCVGVTTDGHNLFVLADNGDMVLKWSPLCGVKCEWHLERKETPFLVSSMLILGNILFVVVNMLATACTVAMINIITGEKVEYKIDGTISLSNVFNNCAYGFYGNRGYICSINESGDIKLKYNVAMDLKKLKNEYGNLKQYSYGYENNCWSLEDWLEFLQNDCLETKRYEPVGKKIYYQLLEK